MDYSNTYGDFKSQTNTSLRLKAYILILSIAFFILWIGLFYTQIVKGSFYKEKSENNRIVLIPLDAPRGKIYDRNGRVIVDNRISFDVSVIYKDAGDFTKLVRFLSKTLGADEKYLLSCMEKAKWRPFAPTLLLEDIGKENAIMLEQNRIYYPGLVIGVKPKRDYLYGKEASSFIGYIGKINQDELKRFKTYGYTVQDLIGRSGIEKRYDNYLRGIAGGMQVETDSRGRHKKLLNIKQPERGNSVYVTIDMELQEFCYDIMGERKGSIIVMNPENGEVLAFVSKPTYDSNIFVTKGKSKEILSVINNTDGEYPMLNRAISSAYPLGSIFKIVVAIAALETSKWDRVSQFICNGSFSLGRARFKCWYKPGHGPQTITLALMNSCNVFFYQLGLKVGVDSISQFAEKFAFGKLTHIDIPGEVKGLVPSRKWKKNVKKESWYAGDTVNLSIGQGYLLVTPIQVARMIACVANGGYLVRPYIVEKVGNVKFSEMSVENTGVSRESLDIVKEGLIQVVNNPRGTGRKAKIKNIEVAGKTGTAQNPRNKAHGWFAGFAPSKNPDVCVVVFVEYGGKGGVEASMIAKRVLEKTIEVGLL